MCNSNGTKNASLSLSRPHSESICKRRLIKDARGIFLFPSLSLFVTFCGSFCSHFELEKWIHSKTWKVLVQRFSLLHFTFTKMDNELSLSLSLVVHPSLPELKGMKGTFDCSMDPGTKCEGIKLVWQWKGHRLTEEPFYPWHRIQNQSNTWPWVKVFTYSTLVRWTKSKFGLIYCPSDFWKDKNSSSPVACNLWLLFPLPPKFRWGHTCGAFYFFPAFCLPQNSIDQLLFMCGCGCVCVPNLSASVGCFIDWQVKWKGVYLFISFLFALSIFAPGPMKGCNFIHSSVRDERKRKDRPRRCGWRKSLLLKRKRAKSEMWLTAIATLLGNKFRGSALTEDWMPLEVSLHLL